MIFSVQLPHLYSQTHTRLLKRAFMRQKVNDGAHVRSFRSNQLKDFMKQEFRIDTIEELHSSSVPLPRFGHVRSTKKITFCGVINRRFALK